MTPPAHPYEIDEEWARAVQAQTIRFTLSPDLWDGLSLTQTLEWHRVKFASTSVVQVPDDLMGVYSFVVEPNIANHSVAYLLYIGKTTRNFRTRFREYLRHQTEERTNRLRVQHMLRTWPDHLSFYYAPIADRDIVKIVEDELIIAFKPPVPRAYPARIRERFNLLDILLGG